MILEPSELGDEVPVLVAIPQLAPARSSLVTTPAVIRREADAVDLRDCLDERQTLDDRETVSVAERPQPLLSPISGQTPGSGLIVRSQWRPEVRGRRDIVEPRARGGEVPVDQRGRAAIPEDDVRPEAVVVTYDLAVSV